MKKQLIVFASILFIGISANASVEVSDTDQFDQDWGEFLPNQEGLAECVSSVQEHVQYYEDDINPSERVRCIQLFGLRNYMNEKLAEAEAFNTWITDNGYKNFPTLGEHGERIFNFSMHCKPLIEELRSLVRGVQKFENQMYSEIKAADRYVPLLQQVELSLVVIAFAKTKVQALPALADFEMPESESSLHRFINGDGFELAVLNAARTISIREANPLNVMVLEQKEDAIQEILGSVDIADLGVAIRQSPDFIAKVREIIDENF